MRISSAWLFAAVLALGAAGAGGARADMPSPAAIQAQIAGGDVGDALSELRTAVQIHPDSGVAWYLTAEAQDAAGHEAAARAALAKAEQLAPGLPFASQRDVAALQAHLNANLNAHGGGGLPTGFIVIGALVVLFVLVRVLFRARRAGPAVYNSGYGQPGYPYGPTGAYGPGYGPGYGGGVGGGVGGALLTGLAAGAGIAAGERLIDDIGGQNQFPTQDQSFNQEPPRDDGLQGDPGWDDNSGGNFDPSDSW